MDPPSESGDEDHEKPVAPSRRSSRASAGRAAAAVALLLHERDDVKNYFGISVFLVVTLFRKEDRNFKLQPRKAIWKVLSVT